ncbi:NifU family protein [Streptomyces thermospinosisporus]|uniref:NifU family protein n=1 Tax=Streptomyces thermospinosisporus TaxID=161482 RepID=A0ABP4JPA4_9ACTN
MSGAQGAADRGTVSAEAAGRMVEEVLDRLAESGDPAACEAAEELVRVLMQFYGAGLARIVELLGRLPGAPGEQALTALLDDEVVASLLVLHDLHPADVEPRIARALDAVPYPVENAGFDTDSGALRLRLTGSAGCGCGSTREAVEQAARDALAGLAPEVTEVRLDADTAREPVLLQIGSGPPGALSTSGRPPAGRAS